jgi:hypothetical protein
VGHVEPSVVNGGGRLPKAVGKAEAAMEKRMGFWVRLQRLVNWRSAGGVCPNRVSDRRSSSLLCLILDLLRGPLRQAIISSAACIKSQTSIPSCLRPPNAVPLAESRHYHLTQNAKKWTWEHGPPVALPAPYEELSRYGARSSFHIVVPSTVSATLRAPTVSTRT